MQVDSPDSASVNKARRDIINPIKPKSSTDLAKTSFESATTMSSLGVKAGLTIKGSAFGVDANASLDQSYKSSTVVATIRQVFYTTTFTPSASQAAGFWPVTGAGSIKPEALTPFIGPSNPPLYISSVQYGRFICVTARASHSSSDLEAALIAYVHDTIQGTASASLEQQQMLDSSEMKVYTIGVPGYAEFQDLANPLNDLTKVYQAGLSFSVGNPAVPDNPGAPISFTCRHIADGSPAGVSLVAEYVQPISAVGGDVPETNFQVFDGPGGGTVNTRITVNAGDHVTISADRR